MVSFLIEYGPEVCKHDDRTDTRNALKMLLDASKGELQLTESLRERVNVATGPILELVWWGSFENLCAGRGEFATAALQCFRKQQGGLAPVTREEIDDFVDFLSELE
jgi:hypothetical protein